MVIIGAVVGVAIAHLRYVYHVLCMLYIYTIYVLCAAYSLKSWVRMGVIVCLSLESSLYVLLPIYAPMYCIHRCIYRRLFVPVGGGGGHTS